MDKTTLARNIMLMEAAGEVCAAAHAAGISVILLKGAALLEQGVYGLHERQMTDIDLFLKPGSLTAFERVISNLGYKPMENSSQAWYKMSSPDAPPSIIDAHIHLWHVKRVGMLWETAFAAGGKKHLCVLSLPDQFLHLAVHTLLYHGYLGKRTIADLARLLEHIYKWAVRGRFWLETAALCDEYALSPAIYPVLKRLCTAYPLLAGEGELVLFEPRGLNKLKSRMFDKAAGKHSNLLEYLLPALHRPDLAVRYLFPGGEFLRRRYGKDSRLNQIKRPFQLLLNIFRHN
jgi:hypothetical protein